jgi:hypothetical protein
VYVCACDRSYLVSVLEKSHYSTHVEENTGKSNMVIGHARRNILQQIKYEGESKSKVNLPIGILQSTHCEN